MVSDHMLISILSVSVQPLVMCAEAVVALAPWARDLKPEDLLSPFLLVCVFNSESSCLSVIGSLARLALGEFSIGSPLEFKQSATHFHRHLSAAAEPLPHAFLTGLILKVLVGLVVELPVILDKVHNSILI